MPAETDEFGNVTIPGRTSFMKIGDKITISITNNTKYQDPLSNITIN